MRILMLVMTLLFTVQAAPTTNWQTNGAILTDQAARSMSRLCYRGEIKVSAQWNPSSEQITQLETKLKTEFLTSKSMPKKRLLETLHRQYAGFISEGRKIVFVNFFPDNITAINWRSEAVLMCDGGPSFWSVEYEVSTKKFVNTVVSGRR
jgi:hypothetical protein